MGIATFSGDLKDFDATLADGKLAGAAQVASIEVKDENLHAHLLSPEFFDAERHPEVTFSTELARRRRRASSSRARSRSRASRSRPTLDGTLDRPDHRPVRQRALRPRR